MDEELKELSNGSDEKKDREEVVDPFEQCTSKEERKKMVYDFLQCFLF